MKTWQERTGEEMRRLVAASDGLLALGAAGAPAEAVMKARDSVCDAVTKLNTMLKKDWAEKQKEESRKQKEQKREGEKREKESHEGTEGTEAEKTDA